MTNFSPRIFGFSPVSPEGQGALERSGFKTRDYSEMHLKMCVDYVRLAQNKSTCGHQQTCLGTDSNESSGFT